MAGPAPAVRSPATSLEAWSLTASDDSHDSRGGGRARRGGPAPGSRRSSPGGSARPGPGPSSADQRWESVPAATLTLAPTEGTADLVARRLLPGSRQGIRLGHRQSGGMQDPCSHGLLCCRRTCAMLAKGCL